LTQPTRHATLASSPARLTFDCGAVMWKPFKCRLFREHDYQLRREPGALLLECKRCGHRSPGWNVSERRVRAADSPLRLLMAASGEAAARAVGAADEPGLEIWGTSIDAGELRLTFAHGDSEFR